MAELHELLHLEDGSIVVDCDRRSPMLRPQGQGQEMLAGQGMITVGAVLTRGPSDALSKGCNDRTYLIILSVNQCIISEFSHERIQQSAHHARFAACAQQRQLSETNPTPTEGRSGSLIL
jgi:hypothetical protein